MHAGKEKERAHLNTPGRLRARSGSAGPLRGWVPNSSVFSQYSFSIQYSLSILSVMRESARITVLTANCRKHSLSFSLILSHSLSFSRILSHNHVKSLKITQNHQRLRESDQNGAERVPKGRLWTQKGAKIYQKRPKWCEDRPKATQMEPKGYQKGATKCI